MKEVLFLQLDFDHFSYHIVPIAAELSKRSDTNVAIGVLGQSKDHLERLINECYPDHQCDLIRMDVTKARKIIDLRYKLPIPRVKKIFQRYQGRIKKFDVVISPSFAYLRLQKILKDKCPPMIYCAHGAGDGGYGFDPCIREFALMLVPGPKVLNRMEEEDILPAKGVEMVGYPKFDLLKKMAAPKSFFGNHNPTFFYNPHFRKDLSSYYDWGNWLLEYFYQRPEYNLIFAPHISIFKRFLSPSDIDRKYYDAPNIHIDTGSENAINMTYIRVSDAYIGDASSQVYEFLYKRRPCLFLNAQGIEWVNNNNYLHWQAGEVVDDIRGLARAVETCFDKHKDYKTIQDGLFEATFELTDQLSGQRAAKAINHFLEQNSHS